MKSLFEKPEPQPCPEGGAFGELLRLNQDASKVPFHSPALPVVVHVQEQKLGRRLSEAEFNTIRDRNPAILMDLPDYEEMVEMRGQNDITFDAYELPQ